MRARPKQRGSARKYPQLYDTVWLKSQLDAGRTYTSIAADVGCSITAVRLCAGKAGLLTPRHRPHHRHQMRQAVIRGPEDLLDALRLEGEAPRVFAEDRAVDVEVI